MHTGQQGSGGGAPEERFWLYLAERTGGRFEAATKTRPDRVIVPHGGREYAVEVGKQGMGIVTRCRVLFVSADGFRFRVCSPDIDLPTRLRQLTGAKDVEIGVPYFDKKFVIEASDAEKVKTLLDDPALREQFTDLRRFDLATRQEKTFPPDTLELRLLLPGRTDDVSRLQYLQVFTATILDRLTDLGSVAPTAPGAEL
jgi:hypothetical protein